MSVIRQSYIIHGTVGKVWEAMMDPAGPTKLFREMARSKNLEIKPKKTWVQFCWMGKQTKPSRVQISLTYENQRTYIDLLHEDVPDNDRDKINKLWKDSYFGPLRDWVERNSPVVRVGFGY